MINFLFAKKIGKNLKNCLKMQLNTLLERKRRLTEWLGFDDQDEEIQKLA